MAIKLKTLSHQVDQNVRQVSRKKEEGRIMKTQKFWNRAACLAIAGSAVLALVSAPEALAQEKCKRMIDPSAAKSEYPEQHVMDVGDIPGHQVRIYSIHRTYPNDKPNCEGLKRKETWVHGFSDYVDRNGHTWGYSVTTLENGDKIFAKYSGTSHTVVSADGKKKSTYTGVSTYNGGTGMYKGIRGMAREKVVFDPDADINLIETDEEYWIEK